MTKNGILSTARRGGVRMFETSATSLSRPGFSLENPVPHINGRVIPP